MNADVFPAKEARNRVNYHEAIVHDEPRCPGNPQNAPMNAAAVAAAPAMNAAARAESSHTLEEEDKYEIADDDDGAEEPADDEQMRPDADDDVQATEEDELEVGEGGEYTCTETRNFVVPHPNVMPAFASNTNHGANVGAMIQD